MRRIVASFVLVASLGIATPVAAVDITACNQVVPAGETGVVTVDLTCPAVPGVCASNGSISCNSAADCPTGCILPVGVRLEARARLDLAGHTIEGGLAAVDCRQSKCTIAGPGTLVAAPEGVAVRFQRALSIADVTVQGGGVWSGIQGRLRASNVTVSVGEGVSAIRAGKVKATGVDVTGGGRVVSLAGITLFTGSIEAVKLLARDVSVTGAHGDGISVSRALKGMEVSTTDCAGHGVFAALVARARRVTLSNFTATGNGAAGIRAEHGVLKLHAANVTNNGADFEGVDVAAANHPRVDAATVCGLSGRIDPTDGAIAGFWGICTND